MIEIVDTKLYVILDREGKVARNFSTGKLGVFKSKEMALKHAWRYIGHGYVKEGEDFILATFTLDEILEGEIEWVEHV